MSTEPIITVRDFSFSYALPSGKSLEVLNNISFSVNRGEFVSVIGPTGCGKTTLLSNIKGLLAEGKKVSMVFQNSSLFPWRTTGENIAYGLDIVGEQKEKKDSIVKKAIKLVGLTGFEDFYPSKLSGGMKQRVNLARALAVNPEIILMDEPFASLDAQTREVMQEEVLKIWAKQKKTVVFVTHQIAEAVYLSDRVIVLSKRPAQIKGSVEIYLNRPRTNGIRTSTKFVEYVRKLDKLLRYG